MFDGNKWRNFLNYDKNHDSHSNGHCLAKLLQQQSSIYHHGFMDDGNKRYELSSIADPIGKCCKCWHSMGKDGFNSDIFVKKCMIAMNDEHNRQNCHWVMNVAEMWLMQQPRANIISR